MLTIKLNLGMKHITVDEVYNKAIEMYNREVI